MASNEVFKAISSRWNKGHEVLVMEYPVIFALVKWLVLPDPPKYTVVVPFGGLRQILDLLILQQQGICHVPRSE